MEDEFYCTVCKSKQHDTEDHEMCAAREEALNSINSVCNLLTDELYALNDIVEIEEFLNKKVISYEKFIRDNFPFSKSK